MDNIELRDKIVSLQYDVERLHREKRELEHQLYSANDKKERAEHKAGELQKRSERAYDAYVTQTYEGYVPSQDYDDLEKIIERYEALDIYVIEMRVVPEYFASNRDMFSADEAEWRMVDHNRKPSKMAYLSKDAAMDLPTLDYGWEARARHLLTGKVIAKAPKMDQ